MRMLRNVLIIILLVVCLPNNIYSREMNVEEASDVLKKTPDDVEALKVMGLHYLNVADYENAEKFGTKLFELGYKNQDYHNAILWGHIIRGQAFTMLGNTREAYNNLKQAELLAESSKDYRAKVSVKNGLGIYHYNAISDYPTATSYFIEGIKIAKKSGHTRMANLILANLADISYNNKDTVGIKYAKECYANGKKDRDPFIIFAGAMEMSHILLLKKHFNEACDYVLEAEELMNKYGYKSAPDLYTTKGIILTSLGENEKAKEVLNKAVLCSKDDPSMYIPACGAYARTFANSGDYRGAVSFLLRVYSEEKDMKLKVELLPDLAEYYFKSGDFISAYKTSSLYNMQRDSLYSLDKDRIITEMRVKYDVEMAEETAASEKLISQEKQRYIYMLLAVIILILIGGGVLFNMYRKQRKLYTAIVNQNTGYLAAESRYQKKIEELTQELAKVSLIPSGGSTSLTRDKAKDIIDALERLMRDEKAYKDPMISKENLADKLSTNRTYLSQAIKDTYGMNFTGYINSLRIHEAVRLLSDPTIDIPLKALSSDLGFSSNTTFYSHFKNETGMTPSAYRAMIMKS